MTEKGLYQLAIYHLQQGYEKCIKSYFVFKEVSIKNESEAAVYRDLIARLGHDTDESTINLLNDIADLEKHGYETVLSNTSNLQERDALQNTITAIDNYKTSLDRMVQKLDLETNYSNNVRN